MVRLHSRLGDATRLRNFNLDDDRKSAGRLRPADWYGRRRGRGRGTVTVSTSSPGGAAANPSYLANNPVGYGAITTGSNSSPYTCTSTGSIIVTGVNGAPGTGYGEVIFEQTGTVNVYFGTTSSTSSSVYNWFLPGIVGATLTLPTTSTLYCATQSTSQAVGFGILK